MCDDHSIDDMIAYGLRGPDLSRRRFGTLTFGAGLALLASRVASAREMSSSEVDITTPDGTADAYFVHPATGKYPGVLIWPDAGGLRPAFKLMAHRLAEDGYSVLVPNPFYRTGKGPVLPPGADMQDEAVRKKMMAAMGSLNPATHVTDARAFVGYLDSQPSVDRKRKMGTTGYCMGGPITMRTAATFPDRIGAGASFHGGGLVTDRADSPHLLVPKLKAQYLIAIAENDDLRQPEAKTVLREAFDKAMVPAEIEVYAGTMHGWCPPDTAVYNEAQAEKAWARLQVLFGKALV
ncbi:MAG TPA: dienelactone hydrolase family protein [Steroidobacteraceae bacterium]|nr:dienelactone hydrolase family protein [Steroidobacteraceae bacterium]